MKMARKYSPFTILSILVLSCSLIFLLFGAGVRGQSSGTVLRAVRQAPDPSPPTTAPPKADDIKKKFNIADDVDEDFPVVFNIILFISISLILALIAICAAIATMDPGRDSLIYRVTSAQRYKKDN